MEAYMLDMTAELDDPAGEGVPVQAAVWGIVDVPAEGDAPAQAAGISVFVDMGAVAFEVDIPVAEVLACLFRATNPEARDVYGFSPETRTSFETAPDDPPHLEKGAGPAMVFLPDGTVIELAPGDELEIGAPNLPCPECGPDGCVDVEDLV